MTFLMILGVLWCIGTVSYTLVGYWIGWYVCAVVHFHVLDGWLHQFQSSDCRSHPRNMVEKLLVSVLYVALNFFGGT